MYKRGTSTEHFKTQGPSLAAETRQMKMSEMEDGRDRVWFEFQTIVRTAVAEDVNLVSGQRDGSYSYRTWRISNWKKNTQKNITRNMTQLSDIIYMNFILASYGNEREHCTWLIEYAKWTFTDDLTDWTFTRLICLWLCVAIGIMYDVCICIWILYACAGDMARAMTQRCKQRSKD